MNKRFAAYSPQNDKKLVIYAESLKAAHAKAGKNKWFTDVSYNTQPAPRSPKKLRGLVGVNHG